MPLNTHSVGVGMGVGVQNLYPYPYPHDTHTHNPCGLPIPTLFPNEVTRVTPNVVKLKLPKTLRIHPVVNVSCVKPYLGPLPSQPVSRPGPIQVLEECDEEYEVDYIVASRIYRCQLQYLVHWKGYEEHEWTWEPASNVKNTPLVVEHFYKEHPSAHRKLHMTQSDFDSLFKPVPKNLTVCNAQFCSLESCS